MKVSLSALCLVFFATTAQAQLFTTGDDSAARAPAATPPLPLSAGVGNGFGGQIGTGVSFAWDTDVLGNVSLDVLGGACQGSTGNPDTAVIYLDTDRLTGFASTTGFTDTSDRFRAAVSGNGTTSGTADLTFAPTITADYAIAFFNPNTGSGRVPEAHLYQLVNGGAHVLVATLTAGQVGAMGCAALRIEGFTLADIGLSQGDLFRWTATVINASNAFRGNEFHGSTYGGANIGSAPFAMAMGDFNVFTSVGRVIINEVDADTPSTDTDEFIELFGPAGVRLDGTVLTLFNGSSDTSYDAIDLDGGVTDSMGYYVLGSATVPNVDNASFTTNSLQNGADGVGFYLADAGDFPSGSAVTATDLVDAFVYDTNDADDAGLLGVLLLGGEPQVNEDAGTDKDTDSNSRCPNGTGEYRTTSNVVPVLASPGAPNECPVCGNGTTEFGEDCDDGVDNGTASSCCLMGCSFRAADEVCGAASGACDLDDTCDGAGTCVANVEPATTECRASAGDCDVAENCNGTDPTCPSDAFEPSTVECRASAGMCDIAESCTGSDADCPADAFEAATVECRASTGLCDPAEMCTGADAACPIDMLAGAATVCRAAAGDCDIAETCDGVSGGCPADALEPNTTECRGVAGMCDVAESCTGSDADCPVDGFVASTVECRAAAGPCDVAESCTGVGAACPTDMVAVDGTACENALVCDGAETCTAGVCTAGTALDCADTDLCTMDSCGEPGGCDNAPIAGCCNVDGDCDDADICTADVCSGPGGTCSASPITDCCVADTDCDDGNDCTTDACDLSTNRCMRTPVAGCCSTDADCDDTNACTTDTCNVATGECGNASIDGCCLADGDCDDSNTCTMDTCDLSSNTCDNDAIAGCCTMDSDCDDGDECTTDTCDVGTAACSNEMIDGCGADAGVDAGDDMDAGTDSSIPDGGGADSATGDSGTDAGPSDSGGGGCGCTMPGESPAPGFLTMLIFALALRRRRG